MKASHKTILIIIFVIVAGLCIYLFKDKIAVVLASVYGAGMVLIRKFKSFFSSDDENIDEIETRLKELHKIESDIIDRLQTERSDLKKEMEQLNLKINSLEKKISVKEADAKNYDTYEDWENKVWDSMNKDEQESLKKKYTGEEFDLSQFRYNDM